MEVSRSIPKRKRSSWLLDCVSTQSVCRTNNGDRPTDGILYRKLYRLVCDRVEFASNGWLMVHNPFMKMAKTVEWTSQS